MADTPAQYYYKVSSAAVIDSSGKTIFTGATFTAALNWAIGHQKTISYVPKGTYKLVAHLNFAEGATMYGDGDDTIFTSDTPYNFYLNGVSNTNMSSFKFSGHLQVYGYKKGDTCGHWTFKDIHAANLTGDMESAFWMYVGENGIIDGIVFDGCTVYDSQTYGFLNFGDDDEHKGNSKIRNIKYIDCDASRLGKDNVGWINTWITGYDLVECTTMENLTMTRGWAEENWCSGFHVEFAAKPVNFKLMTVWQTTRESDTSQTLQRTQMARTTHITATG